MRDTPVSSIVALSQERSASFGPSVYRRRRCSLPRAGLTLIEVMIALTILAIGLASTLSWMGTHSEARSSVAVTDRINDAFQAMRERLLGVPYPQLGSTVAAWAWSAPSPLDPLNPGVGGLSEADLRQLGVLQQPSGVDGLRIFLTYYRAESAPGGLRGLLDGGLDIDGRPIEAATPEGARQQLNDGLINAQQFATSPGQSAGEQPIAIVITAVWQDDGQRTLAGVPFTVGGQLWRRRDNILVRAP